MLKSSEAMLRKIEWALTQGNFTIEELVAATGVTGRSAVSEWKRTGRVAKRHIPVLAALTDTTELWWLTDNAPIPPTAEWRRPRAAFAREPLTTDYVVEAPNTKTTPIRSRVPVISWVAAGRWTEAFDPYAPGAAHRWEDLTDEVPNVAFALEVRGDSMWNPGGGKDSFPDGCIIVVDPTRKAKPFDFIVVRNNDWDEATFKQYIVDGGVKQLKPINPQYRATQMPPGTVLVGVVIWKIEKQRY